MTITGLKVTTDKRVLEVELNGLSDLQGHVGGYIEAVVLRRRGGTMYVNEEGKLIGLPFNSIGTDVAIGELGIVPPDAIVGDVLVIGEPDEEGNDTSITQEMRGWVERVTREARFGYSDERPADGWGLWDDATPTRRARFDVYADGFVRHVRAGTEAYRGGPPSAAVYSAVVRFPLRYRGQAAANGRAAAHAAWRAARNLGRLDPYGAANGREPVSAWGGFPPAPPTRFLP